MYFVHTPYIIKKLFSQFVWDFPNAENKIYLTFDDGPHPEITPWILEQLSKYNAKATFFCLGKNAEKYGKIKKSQISNLKSHFLNQKSEILILNWTLMPGDFDQNISSEKCYSNLQKVKNGDIIVLHDNEKSWKHLEHCLPKFLEYCKEKKVILDKINL